MKYFILGAFASAFFVYGSALVFGATGSTTLPTIFAGVEKIVETGGSGAFLLLLGAGGLGAPSALYLAAAGVGTLAGTLDARWGKQWRIAGKAHLAGVEGVPLQAALGTGARVSGRLSAEAT